MIAEVLSAARAARSALIAGSLPPRRFFAAPPGSYTSALAIGIAVSLLSAIAIWRASPGKVRAVAGQMHKAHTSGGEG
jgi:hypothetical protein